MSGNLEKKFSASCEAHAVLTWTIEKAPTAIQNKTKELDLKHLVVRDFGFGASTLRWSLELYPDNDYEDKKDGDPKFVRLYLRLWDEKGKLDQEMKTDTWEDVSGFHASVYTAERGAWGAERAISHTDLFGDNSEYLSDDDSLVLRVEFYFDITSSAASNHFAAACSRQRQLYNVRDSTDSVLVSSDKKTFPIHCIILAAHSSVFRRMFKRGTKEEQTRRAEIDDVDGETLDQLLKYIYAADIKNAEKIHEAADQYDIGDLRDLAVQHLCDSFTAENAYRIATTANQRNLPGLRTAASGFMAKNWASLHETPAFLEMKENDPVMFAVLEAACGSKKREADVLKG